RGNVIELISQTLPVRLPFHELTRHFKVKIVLDSFNEMPREYWETGSYEADFQKFVKALDRTSLVIGSRTTDGLAKLDFPSYSLVQIDEEAVTSELRRAEINLAGRFNHEMLWLLQRPFYFRHIISGKIALPKEPHPRDFYANFFENLGKAFRERFRQELHIA